MKKILFLLIFIVSLLFINCSYTDKHGHEIFNYDSVSSQEWFDKYIKHSLITDSAGHTLIFHEVGRRGWRDYTFSIEHSPECRKCCEIYD